MKNTTITRKSLLFSGFALLLSALLLAGTTFAWFTDTVTNEGNTIQSGELKMDLYWFKWNAEKSQFVQVGMNQWPNAGKMSADNWEPGQSDALLVRVDNMGSLAAKVQLSFDVTNDSGLSKALWFKVTSGTGKSYSEMINTKPTEGPVYSTDTNVICMSELKKWKDDLDVVLEGHNEGTPETEWRNWYLIEYGMYADAGIEYMNGSLTTDIHFNATQAPYEEDGFGNTDYDKDAYIADFEVTTTEELKDALEKAESGDVIALGEGEFQLPAKEIPEGVTICGSGIDKTFITVPETVSGTNTMGLVINQPGVTLSNATFKPNDKISNWNYAGVIVVKEGDTVLDNIKVTSNNGASPILVTDRSFGEGDTLTISNSIITSNARSVYLVDGTNGKVVIDNCEITGVYPLNVNSGDSQNLEIEVKNSKLHGWTSYGYIKSASFTNTEFSQGDSDYNFLRPYADTTWTNCTFGEGFLIGGGASGETYTFNDCQYADGTDVTAENIKNQLLDLTEDAVFECTIIVDGVPVTFN